MTGATVAILIVGLYVAGALYTAYRIQVWLLLQRETCDQCRYYGNACFNHWNDKMCWALIWPLVATVSAIRQRAAQKVARISAAKLEAVEAERVIAAIDAELEAE